MCSPNHEAHRHAWASVLGIERLDCCFEEAPGGLVRQPDQRMRNHLDVKRSRLGSRALRTRSLRRTSHHRRRAPCRQVLSWPRTDNLPSLFVSERQALLTRRPRITSFASPGENAKLGRAWLHMSRHACGYYLADQGTDLRTAQDYLPGSKAYRHHTSIAGHRFEGLWR